MVLEQVRQLAARGPHLANVRLQFEQFFLYGIELLIIQVVELSWIRLVVAKYLGRHINSGEIIPNRNLSSILWVPKYIPAVRRLSERGCVVNKRIRPPHKRHTINQPIYLHQRQGSELRRKFGVAGEL